ncbi:MAG: acetylglutamate kinase [Deltaproteobacteria bacterium]|jgi:acetylglutamate kinase|nr:acetylglutamate kinase [Deltaproteobacteria bacterium]
MTGAAIGKAGPGDRERAEQLTEALPYILDYRGETVVIKFGGHAMLSDSLKNDFAKDVTLLGLLGLKPVIVHGGGPDINLMLDKLGIESRFVSGLRYTDEATMAVVEMVLGGKIGKDLAGRVSLAGGNAVSLSGKDSRLIEAKKTILFPDPDFPGGPGEPGEPIEAVDPGLVGTPVAINTVLLDKLGEAGFIPIISPVGTDANGVTYNVNADTAAAAVAVGMKARRLILLTDVPGVLDERGELIGTLTPERLKKLKENKVIAGGMIPKIECCREALANGCGAASIIDGRVPHSILLELFTRKGSGTEINV